MLARRKKNEPLTIHVGEDTFLPCYRHLIDHPAYIHFLWGGRDSGKSTFIAMLLLIECLRADYFRCILVKKTFESIKDAQWQTLKDIATEWGIDHLFHFTESPLKITCKLNGNSFIARGCDKPEKLKSIKDPTVAWYEEGNQLTEDDFITVSTTLRSNRQQVKQYFSFNPEVKGDYRKHWMWQYFKDHTPKGINTFEHSIELEYPATDEHGKPTGGKEKAVIRYTSTHSTYHHNKYVSSERIAFLESLRLESPYYYKVFTQGKWGNREVKGRFAFAFDRKKHLGKPKLNRLEIVWLSFDFNVNPISCSVHQHYDEKLRTLRMIKLENSDIYKLCDEIKVYYGDCLLKVTGDATGKARSAISKGNRHYYQVIEHELGLGGEQIEVPTVNPPLERSGLLVNAVLARYEYECHEDDASELVYDFENVQQGADGKIIKEDRKDPAQQADSIDTFRYFCEVEMKPYVNLDI